MRAQPLRTASKWKRNLGSILTSSGSSAPLTPTPRSLPLMTTTSLARRLAPSQAQTALCIHLSRPRSRPLWAGSRLLRATPLSGATANTRESLFDAMKRKEVYATTGPRMIVRFFGGWDFEEKDAQNRMPARIGYTKGVPMGGDL